MVYPAAAKNYLCDNSIDQCCLKIKSQLGQGEKTGPRSRTATSQRRAIVIFLYDMKGFTTIKKRDYVPVAGKRLSGVRNERNHLLLPFPLIWEYTSSPSESSA